jgi:hypothetical protein
MRLFFIVLSGLVLLPSARAGAPCNAGSIARVGAANDLLQALEQVPDARKAMQVERVRILLEKVLAEEPGCKVAADLNRKAGRLFEEIALLSSNAAAEKILERAIGLVGALEAAEVVDPAELQATRFLLAALARRLPKDERILALAARAARLGGSP